MKYQTQGEAFNFSEKFLYHIWDAQHLRYDTQPRTLSTVTGKSVQVSFAGHYNTMNGPDFLNATIDIGGRQLQGDVEIHLNSGDWYQHQHDQNPAYNNVILHLVYNHNHHLNKTLTEDNEQIEILEIKDCLSEEVDKLFHEYQGTAFSPHPKYCRLFANIRPEFFEVFLAHSGQERLERKIKRFKAELSFVSIDQLIYQSIFEALGYSKNKHQFYLFAKENSWLSYKQRFQAGMTASEFTEALLAAAGFAENRYNWYMFRIRPCNQPQARISQIAQFIYSSFTTSLITEIQKLFSFTKADFSMKAFKARLYERLYVENSHSQYKLGVDRINALVINVFIPILMVYAQQVNDTELGTLCNDIYANFEGLKENYIDQIMHNYLTESQVKLSAKKAIYQQGLLNTYHRYCINHLCDVCCNQKKEMLN